MIKYLLLIWTACLVCSIARSQSRKEIDIYLHNKGLHYCCVLDSMERAVIHKDTFTLYAVGLHIAPSPSFILISRADTSANIFLGSSDTDSDIKRLQDFFSKNKGFSSSSINEAYAILKGNCKFYHSKQPLK